MFWVRLGIKELFIHRGFSLFFILNLSLGLAGFIGVQSFGSSLDRHMDIHLRQILTADLVLASPSPLSRDQRLQIERVLGGNRQQARLVSFYSMVRYQDRSRLVKVMAMDTAYPLYGKFDFEGSSSPGDIQKTPGLFMSRETAAFLGIDLDSQKNSVLKLGTKSFYIKDFIKKDPHALVTAFELAPKVYMGLDQLSGTGLIGFGSRVRYLEYIRFSEKEDTAAMVRLIKENVPGAGQDTGYEPTSQAGMGREGDSASPWIRVYDTREVNQRLARLTRYFTGYMGLVSIVALFLAGMAAAYLFRGFIEAKTREIAILMGIGAKRCEIYALISFQLMVLGSLAALFSMGFSLLLMPVFPLVFAGLVPDGLKVMPDGTSMVLAMAMGMGGSLVFCLPVFIRLFSLKPRILLEENQGEIRAGSVKFAKKILGLAGLVPGILCFCLSAFLVTGSAGQASLFMGVFFLALSLLAVLGWLVFLCCGFFSSMKYMPGKIAFRNLYRNRWSSVSCFVTIAMGVFLISLIPRIQKGLETEIIRPEGFKIPVFFLVDIQAEQKQDLISFMEENPGDLANISPMVRGRILWVNGQPFSERQKALENQGRRQRMEFNFSHRSGLDLSETIVKGEPLTPGAWAFDSPRPFEVSMAESFARRYGLGLGDLMEFDIQGIVLKGRVKNLRKVKWNSFQPNFFLLFQDGVLNHAPKTYLAVISNLPGDKRQTLKNDIADRFSNVSVIDVARTAKAILSVADKLLLSVRFMALLAIGAGMVSIFSIARHQAWKNENQVNLLKVLGANFPMLRIITLVEFGFVGFVASLSALVLSQVASLVIAWYFFDSLWQAGLGYDLLILVATTVISMATGLGAASKVMGAKPAALLAR